MSEMRQAILVLGMHRSDSALAGTLGLLGARLPARQMPPHADNPKGYFESEKITAIHERMLAGAGSSWFALDQIPVEWFHSTQAASFVDEIVAAVYDDYDDAAVFVIKDPRMCRLVPIWREVLDRIGAQPSYVIALRSPVDVAHSLKRRDYLPLNYGCVLWLWHMLKAELETRGAPRVFENYDDLLGNSARSAAHIVAQLGINELAVNENYTGKIKSFIDVLLRHHHFGVKKLKPV